MVNKAALGVLGVIVLVSMGVGVLIGMQLGGPASAGPTDGNASDGGETSATPDDSTPTRTPFPESPPTANGPGGQGPTVTAAGQTTVSYRRFDERRIASEIKAEINERRRGAGLDPFVTSGSTVSVIDRMARTHSDAMADAGAVRNYLKGNSSADRYREFGLFGTCSFPNEEDTFIVDATGNRLEVIGSSVAGRAYDRDAPKFNENESEVAEALVDEWWNDPTKRERLSWVNAGRIGAGAEVTQDGSVYATVNLC
jgi:hypothetical protein